MQTVGSILNQARINKSLSLKDVEKSTKIREKFLTAIERDDYGSLPSVAYAKGFVKNYSEFLGLDSGRVLAFFRRQTQEVSKSSLLPPQPIGARRTLFQLTPGRFLGFVVLGILTTFFLYFFLQYKALQASPAIHIESPADEFVTESSRIDILGTTDSDATVMVNGVNVLVRSDGKFFDQFPLAPGKNAVTIVATSRFGKTTTITRTVTRVDESH